jgi:Na+-translocating ferredoxin:NAD+ oxidoreductase RnfC subunit
VATLATLKLSTAVKPTHMPAVQVRRNKLAKRLWEQAELAKAQQAGTQFTATKFRTVVENDTGLRKQVEVNKRIKQWWFTTDSGKLALSVRYGARLLELAKGKFAVELASDKELVPTLEIIKAAVLNGELDAAMEVASTKLRSGFQR